MERGSLVVLEDGEQVALRALLSADPAKASHVCMVKEAAISKAASGQPIRAGTASLIRAGLRSAGST